jgi:hypothetical protein
LRIEARRHQLGFGGLIVFGLAPGGFVAGMSMSAGIERGGVTPIDT